MAIDKKLQIFDDEGNPVDYDILASDVKFNDGKDLPTKLDEMEDEIGEGGYTPPQGGIPATDLAPAVQTSLGKADTAYQKPSSGIPATDLADGVIPDTSNLATKTELADKVDKVTGYGLSKNDYTDADKAAVGTIGSKANDNVVVKSISVNGQTPQTPTNGNVNINVQGTAGEDGVTPHIGSNGHWWTGPETDSENDTGVTAQGPAGTSITDADLVIGNVLNGQGDVLGMGGAMRIKSNLDFVYSKLQALLDALGNIAFWEGKPANLLPQSLDWSVPQITVTLDKTNVSAYAMITDDSDQEITGTSVSVDEGSGLTLKIMPKANYAITAASATIGGVSQTLTEDNGVYTLEIASVTSAITIVLSVSAAATILITYGTPSHCSVPSGVTNPAGVLSGGTANIQYECESGYVLTANNITISGATVGTITNVGNVYTIPITHDGTSQSISITASASKPSIRLLRGYYIGADSKQLTNAPIGVNNTVSVDQVVETDYILLPQGSSMQTMKITWGLTRSQEKDATQGPPASAAFFTKENGEYKLICAWAWGGKNASYREIDASSFNNSAYATPLNTALQAGNLYVRSALCLTEANGNTLVSGAGIQWNNVNIFTSADPYTIETDPSLFDSFTMQTS